MSIFNPDTTAGKIFSRLMDLIAINFLFLLTSIPIFTIGASTAAMYDMTLKMAMDEDEGLIRSYFRSFFLHFLKGTGLLVMAVLAGGFILMDYIAAAQWNNVLGIACQIVIFASLFFYLAVLAHAFPCLAYYNEKLIPTIKNAFRLSLKNGFRTAVMVLLNVLPFLLLVFLPILIQQVAVFWTILGFSLTAYYHSIHLAKLFRPQEEAEI